MQYVQRKLQRSVTEMRRSRTVRPKRVDEIGGHRLQATAAGCRSAEQEDGGRRRPSGTPSPSGSTASALADGGRGQLVGALRPDGRDVVPAVGAEPAGDPQRSGSCRRAGGAGRRRRRRVTRGRSSVGVAHHLAQRGTGEQLEARPATTPGCPGRPNTGRAPVADAVPNANGLAGLMAICIQRMSRDAVEHDLHEVEVAHADAAAVTSASHSAAPRLNSVGDRGLVVANEAEVDRRRSPPAATSASSIARFDSRICPGASGRRRRPARRRSTARRPAAGGYTAHPRDAELASTPRCAGPSTVAGSKHRVADP